MRITALLASCALALATVGALAAPATAADDYPSKPINIVVPAGAGGGTDILVRTLQPYLEKALDGTIVVINVPGSGSVGGSRRVAEAKPDGYTLLVNHVTLLTAMALGKADFSYKAYAVAATAVEDPLVVVVPADSSVKSLDDLMALTHDPSKPVIAGVNLGAVNHFAMLMLQSLGKDSQFRFVQTGGGAATTAALLGHHINVGVLAGSEAKPLVKSGDVRVIAALGDQRIPYFPDAATAKEQGYDVSLSIKFYWLMPAGAPADRVEKFGAALKAALAQPKVLEAIDKQGELPIYTPGAQSETDIATLYDKLKAVAATLK